MPNWDTIKDFIQALGWTKGVFALFFFMTHGWVYKLYTDRINDKQAEIERLVADNREYRQKYLKALDKIHNYNSRKKGG